MKRTTYFVNGASQTTEERKLTPRTILMNAGFTPVEDYRLLRDDGYQMLTDLDKDEAIREGERFTALFSGPTPVS